MPPAGPRAVLVVPIAPSDGGNGLAMRAGMLLDLLARHLTVDLVVVPVAGAGTVDAWAAARCRSTTVVEPVDGDSAQQHALAQVADAELRTLLAQTAPLPRRARLAPPTLARGVAATLTSQGVAAPALVLVMREYLVPFGVHLGRLLGARRTVVDLDDDVVGLLRAEGEAAEADAWARLEQAWLATVDAVATASALDARHVAARLGRRAVSTVPNAVRIPAAASAAPGTAQLLYVGNLTYGPNVDAATALVDDVLPRVRRSRPDAGVALVGAHDERVAALADRPGVVVAGAVADVAPWYAAADVVVLPIAAGSGTRIKVLEALAHRRPVVATPTALAGLELRAGVDAIVGADATELAAAVLALLADHARADAVAAAGFATVTAMYTPEAIEPALCHFAGVTGHGGKR